MTPESLLAWKLRLFAAGAVFMLIGVVLGRPPIVLAGAVPLAGAIVLRIIHRPPPQPRHPSWDEEE